MIRKTEQSELHACAPGIDLLRRKKLLYSISSCYAEHWKPAAEALWRERKEQVG